LRGEFRIIHLKCSSCLQQGKRPRGSAYKVGAKTGQEREVLGIPFAKNSHPMWIFDSETLAFLEVNDAAVKAYGFSRQEFLGMTLRDIRPADDVPELLRQTQPPPAKGQSTGEKWRHRTKFGAVFPVTITSWDLNFRGHKAELVLARREQQSLAAAAPAKLPGR
jgi:PAS domain S-box-containing protein